MLQTNNNVLWALPEDRIVLANIEMQIIYVILTAAEERSSSQSVSKSYLVVHATAMACEISHNKG